MKLSTHNWSDSYIKAETQAAANNIVLNHWAAQSVEVLDRGKNLTPHDPDGPEFRSSEGC